MWLVPIETCCKHKCTLESDTWYENRKECNYLVNDFYINYMLHLFARAAMTQGPAKWPKPQKFIFSQFQKPET